MAASIVVVIYSIQQRVARAVYLMDTDAKANAITTRPGEGKLTFTAEQYAGFFQGDLDAALAGQLGTPLSDRQVILDGRSIVQTVVHADPAILDDTKGLPNGWSMLTTDTPCTVGQKYNAAQGTFT